MSTRDSERSLRDKVATKREGLFVMIDGERHDILFNTKTVVPNKVIEVLKHDAGPMGEIRHQMSYCYAKEGHSYLILR